MVMVLASRNTEPEAALPTKIPVAPSVTSVTTTSKVKAPKLDPNPPACVEQDAQARVKFPKFTFPGTALTEFISGTNARVASAPDELCKTRLPEPLNPVPPDPVWAVLKVMVVALAPAAIMKTATPVTAADRIIRSICMLSVLLC